MAAVDVNGLTFGVELETCMPVRANVRVGGYHAGVQVPQLPEGWEAERDSSISCPAGYVACELVSPVLKGVDGLRQMVTVLRWLNGVGAKVNSSCGFHVHVGFDTNRAAGMARLIKLVARHEKALYASTGTRSREEGTYCKPIKPNDRLKREFGDKAEVGLDDLRRNVHDRYVALNLCNLAQGRRPAVEFRVFGGTLSETKAVGYVRMCLGLVERACNNPRSAGWDEACPGGLDRKYKGGEGRKALAWLFYALGWRNGSGMTPYGLVHASDLPTQEVVTLELYRLAEKYDGVATTRTRGHRPPPFRSPDGAEPAPVARLCPCGGELGYMDVGRDSCRQCGAIVPR